MQDDVSCLVKEIREQLFSEGAFDVPFNKLSVDLPTIEGISQEIADSAVNSDIPV